MWKLDEQKLDIFQSYCEAMDVLVKEYKAESVKFEVNEETMEISAAIECDEVVAAGKNHAFCELVKRSVRLSFSATKNDLMTVKFVFPSMWD